MSLLWITAFLLSACSIVLAYFDKNFQYQWLIFYSYLTSVIVIASLSIFTKNTIKKKTASKKYFLPLIVFFLSLLVYLFVLKDYPFVSLGDEVRDCGRDVLRIYSGQIKDLFGYGNYGGYGLIIPDFIAIIYPIFGNTVYLYRLFAVFISAASITLMFLILRKHFSVSTCVAGCLLLLSSAIHLHYGRTEPVVIFNSLITALLLYGIERYFSNKDRKSLIMTGLIVGFSFNFHSAVRVVGILIFLFTLITNLIRINKKNLLLLILYLTTTVIGFGPTLLKTDFHNFFQLSRLPTTDFNFSFFTFTKYLNLYIKSIGTWFFQPVSGWFPDHRSLYPLILLPVFIFGLYSLLRSKLCLNYKIILLTTLLVIPFSNSAITDAPYLPHRLIVLLPLGSIIFAWGLDYLSHRQYLIYFLYCLIIFIYSITNIYGFYRFRKTEIHRSPVSFILMHAWYTLKPLSLPLGTEITMTLSKKNAAEAALLHYQEQRQYFLPGYSFTIVPNAVLTDYQLQITVPNVDPQKLIISCNNKKTSYRCPPEDKGIFKININGRNSF